MENNKIYCVECSKNVQYHIKQKPVTIIVKDIEVTYIEKSSICNECGDEIYHPAINDYNVNAREEAYLKAIIDINQKISASLKEILEEQKKLKEEFLVISEENLKLKKENKKVKLEATREFADLAIKTICEQVCAPTPSESYIVEKCNQIIDNLAKKAVGENK